jgi:hypothetical protein
MSGLRAFAAPVLLLGLLALSGCATPAPYAPRGPGQATGYTDRQISTNRWRITFTGNSVTPRDMVENDLLLRAAEVTMDQGKHFFLFDTRDTRARTRYDTIPQPDPFYYGYYGYWNFRPAWGYPAFGPDVTIIASTKYEAYAEIVLLTDEEAAKEPRAVDARSVIAHLRPPPPPPQSNPPA